MRNFIVLLIVCTMASCGSRRQVAHERIEDAHTKALLQGVWTDISNEYMAMMQFVGDTVNYINNDVAQQTFKVFNDTLYTYGLQTNTYPIVDIDESNFVFLTPNGETVHLQKKDLTNEEIDELKLTSTDDSQNVSVQEVIKKDKVVTYKGKPYHGYVFINPTTIKVLRPGLNDMGLEVENYSYDNIIHICVYQGKNAIYGKDIKKDMFKDVVPQEFLQYSILSDMDFEGVDKDEFLFVAEIGIPDNELSYRVQLRVSQTGETIFQVNNPG